MMRWVIALVAALAIGGVALFNPWNETEHPPLRIGLNLWPGYEPLALAEELGFYDEAGVSVRILNFTSLQDCKLAFQRGQIDLMACTIPEVLFAYQATGKLGKIFLIPDFSNGGDMIVARRPLSSVSDLKGKRVAVEPASLGLFMLSRSLDLVGISIDEVTAVTMGQGEMVSALRSEKVDAAITYPPFSSQLLRDQERMVKLFDSSEIPGEVVDVLVATEEVVRERKEDLRKIQQVWEQVLSYVEANRPHAIVLMAAREGIQPYEFEEALTGMKVMDLTEQRKLIASDSLHRSISRSQRILKQRGFLKEELNPSLFIAEELLGEKDGVEVSRY